MIVQRKVLSSYHIWLHNLNRFEVTGWDFSRLVCVAEYFELFRVAHGFVRLSIIRVLFWQSCQLAYNNLIILFGPQTVRNWARVETLTRYYRLLSRLECKLRRRQTRRGKGRERVTWEGKGRHLHVSCPSTIRELNGLKTTLKLQARQGTFLYALKFLV